MCQDFKASNEESEEKKLKNYFLSFFVQARNFQVLFCVFVNLFTRKEQLFKSFKWYTSMRKSKGGLCAIT